MNHVRPPSAWGFTSTRERRLWLWTLAVIAAIFATLGLTGHLAETLADDNLAAIAFGLALLLVAATILTQGLQTRPRGVEIAIALGIAAVSLMLLLRFTLAERTHLIEYGVLAVFIHAALTERRNQGRRVPVPALLAILAAALIGTVDETIQLALPSRVFDPQDILFNVLAAVVAVATSVALGWLRRNGIRR